jgi:hypothetical protein
MSRLVRFALRKGWHRGVKEGHRGWLVAGGAAVLIHLLQRAAHKEEGVVYQEVLRPGEAIVITHERPA